MATPVNYENANLRRCVDGYLETGLWSESCNGTAEHEHPYPERPEDCDVSLGNIGFTANDVSDESRVKAEADCRAFLDTIAEERPEAFHHMAPEIIGRDFWLTRNGHGAGFWDHGLGELGDWLTAMAKPYGEVSMWVRGDQIVEIES